jgi:murein DD-endopeptidase MepM/ murein hydrolase activator NlpD
MKRLIILYKFIVTYKKYLLTTVVVFVFAATITNYDQRIETLNRVSINTSIIKRIDETTTNMWEEMKANKRQQDSMRIIVDHLPTGFPLSYNDISRVSSDYGYRFDPISKLWTFHGAKDFSVKPGAVVYATGAGIVTKATMNATLGKYITINNGFGYETTFAHLSSIDALPGYIVKKGDPIAVAGNTGWSTGTHLHYVMKYVGKTIDPDKLMQL